MPIKMEDLVEFAEMKSDFQRISCRISIRGGMKKRGYTEHDLDIDLQIGKRKNLLAAFSKMKKWNRVLLKKYSIFLDVQIFNMEKEHIFDFDGRFPFFIKRPWERAYLTLSGKVVKEDTRK